MNAQDRERLEGGEETRYKLSLSSQVDNKPGWNEISLPQPRNVALIFDYSSDLRRYQVRATGLLFGVEIFSGILPKSREDLIAAVGHCLDIWERKVTYRQDVSGANRFTLRWDFSAPEDKTFLDEVWLDLARAGEDLSGVLFSGDDEGLNEIRERLFTAIAAPRDLSDPMRVTIHSDDLFAPWWMLYTQPHGGPSLHGDRSGYLLEGFWGYKHLIEHQTKRSPHATNVTKVAGRRVRTGLNVDPRIDTQYQIPFVVPVTTFLKAKVTRVTRELKEDLNTDIRAGKFTDEITYFGCHGGVPTEGAPYLLLKDDNPITAADIDSWLPDPACLPTKPVVFINACQGGKMSSLFFGTLGRKMLAKGANCVIGPQVDIPIRFAAEYATRLFDRFLNPGQRLGEVVLELTREFANRHRNPLGLTYSLYRGIDIYLARNDGTLAASKRKTRQGSD